MTIEIKGFAHKAINNQESGKPADAINSGSQSSSSSARSSAHSDRVSLTSSATMLSALEEQINSLPAVDINRVAETRLALATGTHQINAGNTADGLLAAEHAFSQNAGTSTQNAGTSTQNAGTSTQNAGTSIQTS